MAYDSEKEARQTDIWQMTEQIIRTREKQIGKKIEKTDMACNRKISMADDRKLNGGG